MNKELLDKFFNGNCTPEELQEVLRWYSSNEEDASLEIQVLDVLNNHKKYKTKRDNTSWDKKGTLQEISNKINYSTNHHKPKENNKGLKSIDTNYRNIFTGIAATVLVIIGISFWYNFETSHEVPTQLTTQERYLSRSTVNGQKLNITLSDGTSIKLNANSSIRFKENFSNSSERVVYLEGEAFFDVFRDTLRPFIIKSGEFETTVLGTSFSVNSEPTSNSLSVSVLTGKVAVQKRDEENSKVYLEPGKKAESKQGGKLSIEKYDYNKELAWKDGVLHFENSSFSEVAKQLERWYGKKIIVKKKGIAQDFTGTYKNKPLKDVLEGLAYVLHFEFEINKDEVIIR